MRLPILVVHISAGVLGILSGAVAMSFRKGSHRHGTAGKVFVLSMLSMSASAVCLALMKHQIGNVLGGVFTFYLVATAWATARRGEGETGMFDRIALLFVLVVGASNLILGLEAAQSQAGTKDGYPAGLYFFSGSLALLAAGGDVRMLLRNGVTGTQRLIRHLWRMCYALFVAAGSLFIGQQQVFPTFLRRTNVLFLLGFLPLTLMIFWLLRVRFANTYREKEIAHMHP